MRRTMTVAIALLAALAAGGCGATSPGTSGDETVGQTQASGGNEVTGDFSGPHACDLLTKEIATQVMGVPAKAGTVGADTTRGGARYTTCGYVPADLGAPILSVNLALDAPVDSSGIEWVENAFSGMTRIDPNASPVPGYGDRAVWSPQTGQLVVMANGWWMSFMVGESLDVTTWTLEDAQRLADLVLPTL